MLEFKGIKNSMPTVGGTPSMRDYVILGNNSAWESDAGKKPIALEFLDGQRQEVKKETHDWMCRGLDFSLLSADGPQFIGTLVLSDGSKEQVKINVESVC